MSADRAAAAQILADHVIVLTGASSGIGLDITRGLAARGAKLVLGARRIDRLRDLAGELPHADVLACDVTDAEDRAALVDLAMSRHGRIDGLVNNAGVGKSGPALRESVEDFRLQMEVNVVAPFALSCLVAARMREGGGARSIVNVASAMAFVTVDRMPEAGYAASKAALVHLTRELASQWGRYGIRVNAIAPGYFPSEMTAPLLSGPEGPPAWMLGQTPLGRIGAAEELDDAVAFLLGPGSGFVTGHTLVVDGGLILR